MLWASETWYFSLFLLSCFVTNGGRDIGAIISRSLIEVMKPLVRASCVVENAIPFSRRSVRNGGKDGGVSRPSRQIANQAIIGAIYFPRRKVTRAQLWQRKWESDSAHELGSTRRMDPWDCSVGMAEWRNALLFGLDNAYVLAILIPWWETLMNCDWNLSISLKALPALGKEGTNLEMFALYGKKIQVWTEREERRKGNELDSFQITRDTDVCARYFSTLSSFEDATNRPRISWHVHFQISRLQDLV